ncbi:nucleotide triphosphate diphosphatase NUDT15-like [Ornithodoros turicata]|uniref:Nucleotide triphosphate diphosphatase NUDT15 n=1 Tax=Ornithodoros turicata TaxID=34597 RepID=A0A2R5LIY9_9ACAR
MQADNENKAQAGSSHARDDLSPLQKYMQMSTELKAELKSTKQQLESLETLRRATVDSLTKQAEALPVDSLIKYTGALVQILINRHNISFDSNKEELIRTITARMNENRLPVQKRPGIGVAVFVLSEKHPESVLLGRRKGSVGQGLYQVPGGHLEFGESWEQAAYRETLEETGLHIHNITLCSIMDTIQKEDDYHYLTVFMRGYVDETRGSEPRNLEPHKCEGWHWWKWSTIPTPDLLFWCLRDFKAKNLNPF